MVTNNFLVFDTNKANMQTDEEYAAESQRTNGLATIAKANMHNKIFHQASIIAAAIGEIITLSGQDASDADLTALVSAITNAFLLKSDIVNTDQINDSTKVTSAAVAYALGQEVDTINDNLAHYKVIKAGIVTLTYSNSTALQAAGLSVTGFSSADDYAVVMTERGNQSKMAKLVLSASKSASMFGIVGIGTGFVSGDTATVEYAVTKTS